MPTGLSRTQFILYSTRYYCNVKDTGGAGTLYQYMYEYTFHTQNLPPRFMTHSRGVERLLKSQHVKHGSIPPEAHPPNLFLDCRWERLRTS